MWMITGSKTHKEEIILGEAAKRAKTKRLLVETEGHSDMLSAL